MKIRVYYEDTDLGGIVYHTNYIKYCERARSEIFFQQNMKPTLDEKSGFVVRNINADYLATSTLGDSLEVKTELLTLKSSSLVLLQEVWRKNLKLFSMKVVLVYIVEGKPCRIPSQFQKMFSTLSK